MSSIDAVPPRARLPRRLLTIFAASTFAVAAGFATVAVPEPETAAAACSVANGGCGMDPTKTAVLDVSHLKGTKKMEPDSTTSWDIQATWRPVFFPGETCADLQEIANVDVSWNGSSWVLSNQTLTANIVGISVCALSSCDIVDSHSSEYRLYVNVNDPGPLSAGGNVGWIKAVTFTTTDESDAEPLDVTTCTLSGVSFSPLSSSYSATDNGVFECSYDCTQTGASVTITY